MNEHVTKVLRLREAGHVERCHTIPHHGSSPVGLHTFHMLAMLTVLYPAAPVYLYKAILYHDLHERWSGDAPPVIRRLFPDFATSYDTACRKIEQIAGCKAPALGDVTRKWIKALDRLEFFLWCHDQVNLGNRHVDECMSEITSWLNANRDEMPEPCRDFFDNFEWKRTDEMKDW